MMLYKTSYCSHESLEQRLNEATKQGWHLMQLLPHEGKTISIVFYKDDVPTLPLEVIEDIIEDHNEPEEKKPWWKF